MPAPTSISAAYAPSTTHATKPKVEGLAWQTAWQTAHHTVTQARSSTDQDHPTHVNDAPEHSASEANAAAAHDATNSQYKATLIASVSDQAATPKASALPQPVKTADKTSAHQDQATPNQQALPFIAATTPIDPAPPTQPDNSDKAQINAVDTQYGSAVPAQVPQQPDGRPQPRHVTDLYAITGKNEAGNSPAPSDDAQPPLQNKVADKSSPPNDDASQAPMQAKAAGQPTSAVQLASQTTSPEADKTTSSTAKKANISSPAGKADASTPARTPVASTSRILSVYKLNSAAPAADTNIPHNLDQIDTDFKKLSGDGKTIQPLQGANGVGNVATFTPVDKVAAPTQAVALDNLNTAPAALSATITALHHASQDAILIRLDPPNLGHLSIQVKMDAQGAVNVLFIPSTADAAQALQGSLQHLGAALAQSGLALGHADIGGQFSQSGGHNGQRGEQAPFRQTSGITASSAATPPVSGLSAYA